MDVLRASWTWPRLARPRDTQHQATSVSWGEEEAVSGQGLPMDSTGSRGSVLSLPCTHSEHYFHLFSLPRLPESLEKRGGLPHCFLQQARWVSSVASIGFQEGQEGHSEDTSPLPGEGVGHHFTSASPWLPAPHPSFSDVSFSACPLNVALPWGLVLRALTLHTFRLTPSTAASPLTPSLGIFFYNL